MSPERTINCYQTSYCAFKTSVVSPTEETADWEKELQQELQEYEVVVDPENRDDNWDREIEEMLQDES